MRQRNHRSFTKGNYCYYIELCVFIVISVISLFSWAIIDPLELWGLYHLTTTNYKHNGSVWSQLVLLCCRAVESDFAVYVS